MSIYYLDTSALMKRYIPERGTEWINQLLASTEPARFISSALVTLELTTAMSRGEREKRISKAHRDRLAAQASQECDALLLQTGVSTEIIIEARELALRYPLRAYDAIHLATAIAVRGQASVLAVSPPVFVAADMTLLSAAQKEGFATENPNDHP